MSKNWKHRSPFFLLQIILIVQLSVSVFCFYYYYKSRAFTATQTVANEKLKEQIRGMKCDSIDKEVTLEVLQRTAADVVSLAEQFFNFGLFLFVTAGFSLFSLLVLRKKYALSIQPQ